MPRNSILSKFNDASKLTAVNTSDYIEMLLDTDSLEPSRENFYGLREIEALADNMLIAGHIEPIIVGKVDGAYRIISGHRRWHAVKMNKERGNSGFDKIACMVKEMSYNMFMFTLISANAFTRTLSDYELIRQAELLREYTTKLKDEGFVIHGKMRDYLADTLGVSSTKMAQIDSISNNLTNEGKKALESGKINFSKAYETSRLPEEKQREVIADDKLLSGDVKDIVKEMKTEKPAGAKEKKTEKQSVLATGSSRKQVLDLYCFDFLKDKISYYDNLYNMETNEERKTQFKIMRDALEFYYNHLKAKEKN